MTPLPHSIANPEALELRAAEQVAGAERDLAEAEAIRERRRQLEQERDAVAAEIVPHAEAFKARLDAALATVRAWFPGGERLFPELVGARIAFEHATADARDRAGTAQRSRYNPERILAQHPIARLMPLLQMLADASQTREDGRQSADPSAEVEQDG